MQWAQKRTQRKKMAEKCSCKADVANEGKDRSKEEGVRVCVCAGGLHHHAIKKHVAPLFSGVCKLFRAY